MTHLLQLANNKKKDNKKAKEDQPRISKKKDRSDNLLNISELEDDDDEEQPERPAKKARTVHPNLQRSRALGGTSKLPDIILPRPPSRNTHIQLSDEEDGSDNDETRDADAPSSPSFPAEHPADVPPAMPPPSLPLTQVSLVPETQPDNAALQLACLNQGQHVLLAYIEMRALEAKAEIERQQTDRVKEQAKAQAAEAARALNTPGYMASGTTVGSGVSPDIQRNVWIGNVAAENLSTHLAKATYMCGAGNVIPAWCEEDMYAFMKAGLLTEGERLGDPSMRAFDEWYFHKTKEKGKKLKVGGRERLVNKWEAQSGANKAVSTVNKSMLNIF